jgi:CRP-like cAMP-binding protein
MENKNMEESLTQEDIQWLLRTLRKIDFFEFVNLENIDKFTLGFIKKRYRRGEVIIKEGTEGKGLFVIKSGRCLVYRKKSFFKKEKLLY